MSTILIADDHPLFREALRGAVQRLLPEASLCEADSVDALYGLVEANPDADLLLMDLNMPGAHGFSALVHLRALHPQLPVVVVSAREEPAVMRRALDHGALGFIPKSADSETIGIAVGQVLDGERWAPAAAASDSSSPLRSWKSTLREGTLHCSATASPQATAAMRRVSSGGGIGPPPARSPASAAAKTRVLSRP